MSPAPGEALEAAVADHRAGRLDAAKAGYEAVLASDPENLRALSNLGLILLQRKDLGRALPMLAKAARLAPPDHPAWTGYAQALIAAGQFRTAQDLIARRPDAALALRLHMAWGHDLMARGENAAAAEQFRAASELAPDNADTFADLGLAELRAERPDIAAQSLERAVEIAPGHVPALVNLGSARRLAGDAQAAEAAYRKVLELAPEHPAAAHNLAALLRQRGEAAPAPKAPPVGGSPAALVLARGDALAGQDRFDDALACYAEAGKDAGLRLQALIQTAAVQAVAGRHKAALETLDQAVALDPENTLAHVRRGQMRLLFCDYAGGWADYEYRLRDAEHAPGGPAILWHVRQALAPDPKLEEVVGRRVLLVAEQGIGDEVMFASCLPDLIRAAAQVTCICEPRLERLFARSFPAVTFWPAGGPAAVGVDPAAFDKVLAMGSLGRLFRNRRQDFPGLAYLKPSPEVRARWAERLGPKPRGLRIGVSWRGGAAKTGQARRSMTLAQLAPILALPGCEFVSLQYGDVAAEVAAANAGRKSPIRLFPAAEIDDFEDLAGLIQALDVVVSVQNSTAHLAGAIGAECLTLLPQNPEWRYTLSRPVMPWYPKVALFRQPEPGAWAPVVRQVTDILSARLGR